jgi:hypothetical protein
VNRPVVSLLAVLAALAAGIGTAEAVPPPDRSGRPVPAAARVPVSSATAVCPDPLADSGSATQVAVVAGLGADGSAGSARTGRATVASLDGSPVARVPSGGGLLDYDAVKGIDALVVSASGAFAPGLAASMVTRTPEGDLRGLAGTTCSAPGTDFWFVGSGSEVGRRGRVYLTNPSDAVAVADVELFGPQGPIEAAAARGVSVAPHAQQVLQLDALAPDKERLAVHVAVRQGRLAAAVRDSWVKGLDPLGLDWVPAATAPGRHQVVPFVPAGGGGDRMLQIVAPGDADAVVALRVMSSSGTFTPAGLESVDVPAGSVAQVDVTKVADSDGNGANDENLALLLDADVPVTAGLLARRANRGEAAGELGWTAAAPALDGPAVFPGARTAAGTRTELMLLSERTATVEVGLLAPDGRRTSQTVQLQAGSTDTLALAPPDGVSSYAVVVRPVSGSGVRGAVMVTEDAAHGPLFTIAPLRSSPVQVTVPRVRRDLSTGLRAAGNPAADDTGQSSSLP